MKTSSIDPDVIANPIAHPWQRKDFWFAISLGLGFYIIYFIVGSNLLKYAVTETEIFDFFGADHWEWADLDWTSNHKGSHPLILLFLYPFKALELFSAWLPKPTIALLINSLFGSLGVAGAYLVLKLYVSDRCGAVLTTLIFGFSMSQLFFSSLLESYSLAGLTIIINLGVFMVGLERGKLVPIHWFISGLLTFGITITNFFHTIISFLVLALRYRPRQALGLLLQLGGVILITAFCLGILQEVLIDGEFFVKSTTLERELEYISRTLLNSPIFISKELIKHFFLVNFISSSPWPENLSAMMTSTEKVTIFLSYFDRPLRYSFAGLLATTLWLVLAFYGVFANIALIRSQHDSKAKLDRVTALIGIIGINVFNLLLFSIFNTGEMFLFSCLYTFPILLLVLSRDLVLWKYFRPVAVALVISMAINNLSIIQEIIHF